MNETAWSRLTPEQRAYGEMMWAEELYRAELIRSYGLAAVHARADPELARGTAELSRLRDDLDAKTTAYDALIPRLSRAQSE